jgi:tRNA nucleotidyltransferase (CCA-adding enzyme)
MDRPVGVITRKDLDKARLHGFGTALVEEFMTEGVLTIPLEASVAEAHHTMVIHNIGRLPVMDRDVLAGIITRTDLLRALYPASLPPEDRFAEKELPWKEDVSTLLQENLSPVIFKMLAKLGKRADKLSVKIYIVGGVVRDLLLGRENVDLDLVVEGDAVKYIKSWKADGANVAVHSRYKTGTIIFPDGHKVDVATSRREFYEYPVAQPTVSSDSLKHDLYRRDFTINSMAISINSSTWGQLIDYFGGRRDLEKRSIKVLHNLSFVEDPTRVIRGIRLEERLGFKIEDNTLRLLNSCVRGGLLSLLSGFRLRSELELCFLETRPHLFIKKMRERNVWEVLFPGIRSGSDSLLIVRRMTFLLKRLGREFPDFGKKLWLAFLAALLYESPESVLFAVEDRLHLSQRERKATEVSILEIGSVEQNLGGSSPVPNSRIRRYLSNYEFISILFWAAATDRFRVRRRLLLYLGRLHKVESMLTGRDILDLGAKEGPEIGSMLENLRDARLDGAVETREDEINWVLEKIKKNKGE